MKRTLVVAVGLVALAAAVAALPSMGGVHSAAKTYRLSAKLTAQQVVTPKNRRWKPPAALADAGGTFSGNLDTASRKLRWRVSFAGIGGGSAYAEIHIGRPGRFGGIIVRLCSSCKAAQTGVATIRRPFLDQFALKNTWVTVLTTKYPLGVIRGQIRAR